MMEVKWANEYCSMHKILLVGEGDFSFSLYLATAFGSASNIVATSLDPYATLLKKYRKAQSNVKVLKKMGATILHEIDATKMKYDVELCKHKFDRIVFNFPHAGFKGKEDNPDLIRLHQKLLLWFFRNARQMLQPYGEIHVRHKTSPPFCNWNLTDLANINSLALFKSMAFRIENYPGYNNKRGDGSKSDYPFPLGKCSTFMFIDKYYFQHPNIGYMQTIEVSRGMTPEYNLHRNPVKLYGSSSRGSKMEEGRKVVATQAEVDKEVHLRALVFLYGR